MSRVLSARGWDDPQLCEMFLAPKLANLRDPFELKDMDLAVDRTLRALENGEKIGVFGDYDVDGVTSTALLTQALRLLGHDPVTFIPHRVDDGYGVSLDRVESMAAEGITLMITVDTGVSALEEIKKASELGVDVVITDHHILAGEVPQAVAIVNPNREDSYYEGGRLCGVGVVFKFVHALLKRAGTDANTAKKFLRDSLDLVALGTIADVVPLLDENRVLARHGLEIIAKSERAGIRALLDVCNLRGREMKAENVGFILGPRINAAGRTDHADLALELMLTESTDRAIELARKLNSLNEKRRKEESEILKSGIQLAEQQMATDEDSFLVVGGEDYHLGVVGIVAARLAERFHRPCVVLRIDEDLAKGSARSIAGFDLHEALSACSEHLESFGGHAAAAGVRLKPDSIDSFRTAINGYAKEFLSSNDLTPELLIDADLQPGEFSWELYQDLQRLQPFGERNPSPVFSICGARLARKPRIVGNSHLKLSMKVGDDTIEGIGFNLGGLLDMVESSNSFDVAFTPMENNFRGRSTLELRIEDIRASE